MKKQKIIVYSSKNCARCKSLKKWLRKNKVPFTEKSLDSIDDFSFSLMTALVMKNIFVLSAPALEIGDRVFLSDQIFDADNRLTSDFKHFLKGEKPQ